MLIGPSLWQKMQVLPTRYPSPMPKRRPSKTQKTAKGYEIPVPTRGEVDKALAEIAKDAKPLPPKKKRGLSR